MISVDLPWTNEYFFSTESQSQSDVTEKSVEVMTLIFKVCSNEDIDILSFSRTILFGDSISLSSHDARNTIDNRNKV